MSVTVTEDALRVVRLALYQLRQDVGVPESAEAAATDTSLTWAKCRDCLDVAFAETLDAHNWTWKRGAAETESVLDRTDGWPADARNALVYCLARELAVPVAGRVEDMKNCDALYQGKLRDARVHDLEEEVAAVTDPDCREVLAAVCPTVLSSATALPMDLISVTRRIDATKAHARAEVIAAHNWSAFREQARTEPCSCDPDDPNYPFSAPLPPKCVRPLECYDASGRRADWKIVGGRVRSVRPVSLVAYVRDEERLDRWPPLVRRAYVSLVAADVAATVAGSSAEAQRLREAYERDLGTAVLADSRATGSRRETQGRNFYAEAMLRGCAPVGFGGCGVPPSAGGRW